MDLKETGCKGPGCPPLASDGQFAGSCEHDNEYSARKLANFSISRGIMYFARRIMFHGVSQSVDWSVGRSVS